VEKEAEMIKPILILTVFCASTITMADLPQPPRGDIQEVRDMPVGSTDVPVWNGPAADDGTYYERPSSLPTDLPIPMPNPDEMTPKNVPPGDFLLHDIQSDRTTVIPMSRLGSGLEGGSGNYQFGGIWNGVFNSEGQRTFSDLEIANSPSTFPRSTACRLRMQFTDVNGNQWVFVGSGHLVDAETILTAGHCVYTDQFVDNNGITRVVNDWADWIEVYPGSHQGTNHWGRADSSTLGAFTGWTEDGDYDWDIGVIRVTRAVGMLAGWTGWRWGDSCSTITDRVYHNFSFPAANCGQNDSNGNPLHNGQDMYYRSGEFDSCPGNQLHIDTTAGCFSTSHAGMSGSGYYYFDDDGERRVHAQHSNGNGSTSSNGAKIWEDMSDYLTDDFVPTSRGSSFDLQALYLRNTAGVDEPTYLDAGDSLDDMAFTAVNPTNGSGSGTWNFDIYLSTDNLINTSDTLLYERSFSWDFSSMDEVNVNMSSITLPIGLESGTYWVGVRFDTGTDGNNSNNDTSEWDAFNIYVTEVSDAEPTHISTTTSVIRAGEFIDYSATIANNGAQASNVTVNLYASTNQIITDNDYHLGTSYIYFTGDEVELDGSKEIPESLPDNDYYLGIIAQATNYPDADSTNNSLASDTTFAKVTAPSNNDCSDAIDIYLGDTSFSTIYATTYGEDHPECEESGDGGTTVNDIWYTFDSPSSGLLTISTCDQVDYDTDLVLYTGSCGSLELAGCNDDGAGCTGYSSLLEAPVQGGIVYTLRVGGWNYTAEGSGTISISIDESGSGDINGDGDVDVEDLLILIASWGSNGSDGSDLDGNGVVDVQDALILIANWS